ncbi:MAG TPA: PH domain-containing protein [Candidatus Anaerotruncus excrementipullorum]|uniref:PH domain-containing protein n=1 Tax=Candidatus Anaerotruncus excrementipullorum TaxID=2838465 RepID=A0A9D1WSL3_9FIRM|nr:PH domain-containing protein [Candidatus Anaerotruncus excrementipullorum]
MPEEIKLLWKDRKRICGLPITFTKYSLSEDRLFVEAGLLNIRQEDLLLYRIQDISLKLSLGQRIFGVGSVLLQSSDRSSPVLEIKNIRQPRQVKELIHQQVEKMKLARRMRVGEVLEGAEASDLDFMEEV